MESFSRSHKSANYAEDFFQQSWTSAHHCWPSTNPEKSAVARALSGPQTGGYLPPCHQKTGVRDPRTIKPTGGNARRVTNVPSESFRGRYGAAPSALRQPGGNKQTKPVVLQGVPSKAKVAGCPSRGPHKPSAGKLAIKNRDVTLKTLFWDASLDERRCHVMGTNTGRNKMTHSHLIGRAQPCCVS